MTATTVFLVLAVAEVLAVGAALVAFIAQIGAG
jgi:hypothetical protein